MKIDERCATCRFFYEREGECRRRAPVPIAVLRIAGWMGMAARDVEARDLANQGCNYDWPEVEKEDWCGEYEREVAS